MIIENVSDSIFVTSRLRFYKIRRTQTYTMLNDWVRRHALLSFIVRFYSCHTIQCYCQQQQQQQQQQQPDVIMSISNSPNYFKKENYYN